MQSRTQRRRRILQQCKIKKSKLEQGSVKHTQREEDDFEDISEEEEQLEFEDQYDDEYESEEGSIDIDSDEMEQFNNEVQEEQQQQETQKPILKRKDKQMTQEEPQKRVWFHETDEVDNLDFDNKAYHMLHRINTEWPCLSCDYVLPEDELAQYRNKEYVSMKKYPYTVYLAAGTQAGMPSKNQIYLMKLSKLHKTKYDDDDSHDGDSEDDAVSNDEEGDILMHNVNGLKYSVNRIKTMNYEPIVAFWSESTDVTIVDLNPLYKSLNEGGAHNKSFNINQLNHRSFKNSVEGFALDWNKLIRGQLISGGLDAKINVYNPAESDWNRDQKPYQYHKASVEDVQFSPVENFAFASCSCDGTLAVVDMREGKKYQSQILIKAHDCDVNVLSWNQVSTNLMATGGDDGVFKVWDLRYPNNDCISEIQFHTKPITSIQFQPNSDSTLAVSSADHKLSVWDFAVENDQTDEVPDQLMFVHQGQKDLKELRYHPVYYEMITSTSANGFNVFKPTLDEAESSDDEEEEDPKKIPTIKEEDLEKYFSNMSIK